MSAVAGRNAARLRDARQYTRLPLRLNLALLPVAIVVGGLAVGWRGAAGGAAGVGLVVLIFGGGGVASAFAGRGSGGRLLAVTLAGLFARLVAAATMLWLLAETRVADGPSVALAAMLATIGTLATYIWAAERDRKSTSRAS